MIANLLLLALALFLALALVMPWWIGVPFLGWCGWLLRKKQKAELLVALVPLLIVFIGLEIYVRTNIETIFFREQEKWGLKDNFRRHARDTLAMPHADLLAVDPTLKETLAHPHTIEFSTDSLGYRNASDYAGEPYVILGDSFVAGMTNTQSDLLVSQLNAALGQKFYALGYPGKPSDYERRALMFLNKTQSAPRFLWFIFEGNDFTLPGEKIKIERRPTWYRELGDRLNIRELPLFAPRYLALLQKVARVRLEAMGQKEAPPPKVVVHSIHGEPMGFLNSYIDVVTSPELNFAMLGTPEILDRTACAFFIPDKYRVYKPWIDDGHAMPEPAVGLKKMQDYFRTRHIPVYDLTPALRASAKTQSVFWRDDTHWNAAGIQSAVAEVARCLEQDK